jgi:glycosyltransferase involved in cell wall biosynthesis
MALGLPTVTFDTPVAREYLGSWGIYAERGNSKSLAIKLIDLMDDPQAQKQIGYQLRQRAAKQYDWNQAAHKIVNTYREVLGQSIPQATTQPQISSLDPS